VAHHRREAQLRLEALGTERFGLEDPRLIDEATLLVTRYLGVA